MDSPSAQLFDVQSIYPLGVIPPELGSSEDNAQLFGPPGVDYKPIPHEEESQALEPVEVANETQPQPITQLPPSAPLPPKKLEQTEPLAYLPPLPVVQPTETFATTTFTPPITMVVDQQEAIIQSEKKNQDTLEPPTPATTGGQVLTMEEDATKAIKFTVLLLFLSGSLFIFGALATLAVLLTTAESQNPFIYLSENLPWLGLTLVKMLIPQMLVVIGVSFMAFGVKFNSKK